MACKAMATWVILILPLLSILAFSLEYEPSQYVAKQTYLLRENESIGNVYEILLENKEYYVLQIISNKQIVGYIALERYEKKVVTDTIKAKNLMQTAHFLSQYSDFRKKVSDNPSYIWFVAQSAQIPQIVQSIETEKYELQTVAEVMNTSSATEKTSALSRILDEMISELNELRVSELDAVSFESDFLSNPVAGNERKLKEKMISCFDRLELIQNLRKEYASLLTLLRLEIANAQNLNVDEKKSLQKASEMPEEFSKIEQWYLSATSMHFSENLDNMFGSAIQNSLTFADGISVRIKRDNAYRIMFEENETVRNATKNEFLTLKQAYDTIIKEEYYDKWANQEELIMLKANWNRANSALSKEDYDSATAYAKKAIENAIKVYNDGWVRTSSDGGKEIAQKAIIGLIIILVAIIFFRYIKKKGLFYSRDENDYEEVNLK
ncbi:MAG: hypothetical protein N3F05_02170 [Candidatus Diapherotrites archaeon]|nr:hypothetical protein [Candidatus Diapherotrites archaeon]